MPDFDVIIIGSGFGATVLAIDQSNKGKSVLILERGVWWVTPELSVENPLNPYLKARPDTQPVQYWPRPDHRRGLIDFLAAVSATGPLGGLQDFGNAVVDFFSGKPRPRPLYRYWTFDQLDVVSAMGVGGGSLIYSNVTIEPFFDGAKYPVMDNWPANAKLTQAQYTDGWNWMAGKRAPSNQVVTKYPHAMTPAEIAAVNSSDPRLLGRSRFLRDASAAPGLNPAIKAQIVEQWKPLQLQVAEGDPANVQSNHNHCERQGRCFLGCLPAARHTLNKSLLKNLPLAAENRVFVRPLAKVRFIEPVVGGGYTVHYQGLEDGAGEFHPTATNVILAGGTMGTAEILMRSRDKGKLTLSNKLGSNFSTNGDFSGFITVDTDKLQYPIYATRGPINTSHVTFRDGQVLVNVEDAGIPAMFSSLVQRTLDMISKGQGGDLINLLGLLWNGAQLPDYNDPNAMQTEAEMLMNTCWFNCMGVDDASGRFSLDNDNLQLDYAPGKKIADHPTFQKAETILRELAKAMNGNYLPFPMWDGLQPFISRKLVVTHPLGGCPIGGSSTDGVVNEKGQVFNTTAGGQAVYPGLFVADGSMIPGALAVNPTLTIVSMALRVAAALA